MVYRLKTLHLLTSVISTTIVAASLVIATPALAANTGKVSITFDDGFASTYQNALPALQSNNLKATAFITTGFIGKANYMTWNQVKALQNTYGWEIGSHTITHPELPTLSAANIKKEILQSQTALANKGLQATSFATPFGAYDNRVLIEAAKYYNLHRGFWDRDSFNSAPYNMIVVQVQSAQSSTTLDQLKAWIDSAKAQNQWLVLVFHEVLPQLDPTYEYVTTVSDMTQIANYIATSGIEVVKMNHTLQQQGTNLLSAGNFASGLGGWTTDRTARVTHNTATNGRYPTATNSVKFAPLATANIHLFSPMTTINSSATYTVQTFVNANALTVGEFGFYMDEFNAAGEWISGQWLGEVTPAQVVEFTRSYTPTDANVAKVQLQMYLTGGSTGNVFIDEAKLIQY